eukprot:CAMPEP_0175053788 /NCGR_PEP_ID=MMETSP0052_2-20121109/9129_1 /TAXON_ID=51329 ORGANISM="Polytomella parva, Strain SAG 63-3" /NCGR_SAMPLE_ID=MMETSP0052_2 /ASSEMBLY_ACC=CAM_ASM_000194 /LENGTH=308 /DNA_ID=CAMNT_0016318381 /DNA_START=213 /DNA_END=1139 /DNA_ORIENTATION=-
MSQQIQANMQTNTLDQATRSNFSYYESYGFGSPQIQSRIPRLDVPQGSGGLNMDGTEGTVAEGEKQNCTFFLRTGTCAYGDRCKFKHPVDRPPPQLNSRGYPFRKGESDCLHYIKKGWCAFGATCKFNHPELLTSVTSNAPYPQLPQGPYFPPVSYPATNASAFQTVPSSVPALYYLPSVGHSATSSQLPPPHNGHNNISINVSNNSNNISNSPSLMNTASFHSSATMSPTSSTPSSSYSPALAGHQGFRTSNAPFGAGGLSMNSMASTAGQADLSQFVSRSDQMHLVRAMQNLTMNRPPMMVFSAQA